MGPILILAPDPPVSEQQPAADGAAGTYLAPFPEKGADRAAQVFEAPDCRRGRCRLQEIASIQEAVPSLDGPIQDCRQLVEQAPGQAEASRP
jgi:hypothetical protein